MAATHTYSIVRNGQVVTQTPADPEELLALRGELELLHRCAEGNSAHALMVLCNPQAFERDDNVAEVRDSLMDARYPVVDVAISQIDADHPELRSQLNVADIDDKAESFRRRVVDCLKQAKIGGAAELAAIYAESTGLRDELETLPQSGEEQHGENTMSQPESHDETANKPDPTASDDSSTPTEMDSAQNISKDVEDTLSSIEGDLAALNALVEGSDDAAAGMSDADAPSAASDLLEDSEIESVAQAMNELPADNDADESIDQALDAAEADAAMTMPSEPRAGDSDDQNMMHEPQVTNNDANMTDDTALHESDMESIENLAVNADVDAATETMQEAQCAFGVQHSPVASAHEDESAFGPSTPPAQRRALRGRRNTRRVAGGVQEAITKMADFLIEDVNEMWADARQAMEEALAFRDEIERAHQRIGALHREMLGMRDKILHARREAQQVLARIQNVREDANRSKQRADASATDAQNAADRAASAAREAEAAASSART